MSLRSDLHGFQIIILESILLIWWFFINELRNIFYMFFEHWGDKLGHIKNVENICYFWYCYIFWNRIKLYFHTRICHLLSYYIYLILVLPFPSAGSNHFTISVSDKRNKKNYNIYPLPKKRKIITNSLTNNSSVKTVSYSHAKLHKKWLTSLPLLWVSLYFDPFKFF